MILPRGWAETMGHFDAICDYDKHIQQYGMFSENTVDLDHDVVGLEPACLPCVLTRETSRPTSLWGLGFSPLLGDDIALILPRLLFC